MGNSATRFVLSIVGIGLLFALTTSPGRAAQTVASMASACGTVASAQIVTASVPVPAPSLANVVVVPETLGGNDVVNVSLTFGPGQTAAAAAGVTPTANGVDVVFDAISGTPAPATPRAVARVIMVSGGSCVAAPVLVLRVGAALANLVQGDKKTISATIAQDLGILSFAIQSDTIWPISMTYDTSADKTAYRFEAAAKITGSVDAARTLTLVPNSATVQLLQGETPLVTGSWAPGAGTTFAASPCDFLGMVASSVAANHWKSALGGTVFSLDKIDAPCTSGSKISSILLGGSISNGLLSSKAIGISATFSRDDPSGSKSASFTMTDSIINGNISLSNVYLTLTKADFETSVTVNGQVALGSQPSLRSGVVALRFDKQGISLVPGMTTLISVGGIDAALQAFHCAYDTQNLGLNNCSGTVALTVPALGGTVTGTLDAANGITLSGSPSVALSNGYRLALVNAKVAAPNADLGLIVSTDRATLSGGMLGDGGVTIDHFGIARGAVCGSIMPNAIIAGGPFRLSNVQVSFANAVADCKKLKPLSLASASAANPIKLAVTTDANLSFGTRSPSDPTAEYVNLTLTGLGIGIPLDGGRVNVTVPKSTTITGSLFGRSLVGVCPAVLQNVDNGDKTSTVGALPLIVAGVATASSTDIKQQDQLFRVLDDGAYAICAGLHLTPGLQASTTSDLVDAQLVFQVDQTAPAAAAALISTTATEVYKPRIALRSARVSYTGSALTTKIGTRSVTIKSLDLSYSSVRSDWRINEYAKDNKIPLTCEAQLSGAMTVSLQGLAAIGSAGSAGTADSVLNTQLGIGKSCMFADLYGSVTFPIASNSSMVIKELHFATGPRPPNPQADASTPPGIGWYSKVNVEIYAGQGGIALHDAGLEAYDGVPRVSGGPNYGRTLQMNAGWIVNGLAGLVTGLLIHKL